MIQDIPLEISHLTQRLHRDFDALLPPATAGTAEERDRNFLSRALASFAIQHHAGCTPAEAAAAIIDGGGDAGVDGLFYDNAHRLWIVQTKFFANGRGEPDLGDVSKFCNGVEALLLGQFDTFRQNAAFYKRLTQIKNHFADESLEVRALLVYSGTHLVADDRIRLFENLKQRVSPDSDYLLFMPINLTTVHSWLTADDEVAGVDEAEIVLHYPGRIATPYETYYGFITLGDLAQLAETYEQRLVAANIRYYKGSTTVNQQIVKTIAEEPHHFFYLNNGLTAYCQRMSVGNLDRLKSDRKTLKVYGFSIVNGAQTLGSIRNFGTNQQSIPDGYVFLKVISLERCVDEQAFARRITHSTNFQNQIGPRDFAALDPEQARIRSHLLLSNICYHYKDGANTPEPDEYNFSIEEATNALACLHPLNSERGYDFCCRILTDRQSLWSQDKVFAQTEEYRTRYHRLFRPDYSARTIWRAVQAKRVVIRQLQSEARDATGKYKEFLECARWLTLHLLFVRQHPERGEALALSTGEITRLQDETTAVSKALWARVEAWGEARSLPSIFGNLVDCQALKNSTFAELNGKMPK